MQIITVNRQPFTWNIFEIFILFFSSIFQWRKHFGFPHCQTLIAPIKEHNLRSNWHMTWWKSVPFYYYSFTSFSHSPTEKETFGPTTFPKIQCVIVFGIECRLRQKIESFYLAHESGEENVNESKRLLLVINCYRLCVRQSKAHSFENVGKIEKNVAGKRMKTWNNEQNRKNRSGWRRRKITERKECVIDYKKNEMVKKQFERRMTNFKWKTNVMCSKFVMLRCENKMEKENDEKPQTSIYTLYIFCIQYPCTSERWQMKGK